MGTVEITRNLETGDFSIGNGDVSIIDGASIDYSGIDDTVDSLYNEYEAGDINTAELSVQLNELRDYADNAVPTFSDRKTFYGETLEIQLSGNHDLLITQESLNTLAEQKIGSADNTTTSPERVVNLDGVNRLIISPDVISELDPNAFRSDKETVGIEDSAVIITNEETMETRRPDEWMNGEIFTFGDENGIKFVLNDVSKGDVGVQTLVIGGVEIDIGERLSQYNELHRDIGIEVTEEAAKEHGSYTERANETFYIKDPDVTAEKATILAGIHEDIREAVVAEQANPSIQMAPPSTNPSADPLIQP